MEKYEFKDEGVWDRLVLDGTIDNSKLDRTVRDFVNSSNRKNILIDAEKLKGSVNSETMGPLMYLFFFVDHNKSYMAIKSAPGQFNRQD